MCAHINCDFYSIFDTGRGKQKETPKKESGLRLWYDEPASKGKNILNGGSFGTTEEDNTWQQHTLPIGNSFMGATVYRNRSGKD